jgi:hypothetical protein
MCGGGSEEGCGGMQAKSINGDGGGRIPRDAGRPGGCMLNDVDAAEGF